VEQIGCKDENAVERRFATNGRVDVLLPPDFNGVIAAAQLDRSHNPNAVVRIRRSRGSTRLNADP